MATPTEPSTTEAAALPSFHDILKHTLANLSDIEAAAAANASPKQPGYEPSEYDDDDGADDLKRIFNHKYATLGGYRYHYVEEGDPNGETLVLIHGFPDLWYGWRYQIRHLAKQGYRVIAVDNLGYGETDFPKCEGRDIFPYNAKNLAKNMVELLDHLKVAKAVFIGHDWGGAIAWRIGMYFPERCKAIIGIGIPHNQPSKTFLDPKEMAKHFPQFGYYSEFLSDEPETWFDGDTKQQSEAFFGIIYAPGVGTSIEEKQYYIKTYTKTGFHGGLNYYRAARINYEEELDYIGKPYTVPSLMILVEKDPILTPAYVASFKTDLFEDLQRDSIEEGGHNVHTENPEGLNRALDAYLTKFFAKKNVQKEA
ncbi:hypothetical protein BGZ51_005457 [Haplosporangium sp. Z 767]|nr:hypothetical protein BGZ51_005457 [Haplosporangium sp. Z 767]